METLSEFLKSKENQGIVLDSVVGLLRDRGEWGKRGLYAEISARTDFSPAYIGQVLTGKKPFSEQFVMMISLYLEVDEGQLTDGRTNGIVIELTVDALTKLKEVMRRTGYKDLSRKGVTSYIKEVVTKELGLDDI